MVMTIVYPTHQAASTANLSLAAVPSIQENYFFPSPLNAESSIVVKIQVLKITFPLHLINVIM